MHTTKKFYQQNTFYFFAINYVFRFNRTTNNFSKTLSMVQWWWMRNIEGYVEGFSKHKNKVVVN